MNQITNSNYSDQFLQDIYARLKKIVNYAVAPYSHFKVACILHTPQGFIEGVNVECGVLPVTLCAERNAIGTMFSNNINQINAIFIYGTSDQITTPCGMCRQMIVEFCHPDALVYMFANNNQFLVLKVADLLPHCFNLNKM